MRATQEVRTEDQQRRLPDGLLEHSAENWEVLALCETFRSNLNRRKIMGGDARLQTRLKPSSCG